MSKALVLIKSMGIGDLCILIPNVQAISKKIGKPVTILAQKNTHAKAILKNDAKPPWRLHGSFGIAFLLNSY